MKRLTLNRVARATIRVNRKAYTSLFLGILTAVFLATAASLCAWGTVRAHEEQMAQRVGWMDMFILDSEGPTDDYLRGSGFFREVGHVTVNAVAEESNICAGYYDETAEKLMNRTLAEGRMPEKAGEIAAERSALIRLGREEAGTGDTLTLKMRPINGIEEEKTFTLTGILNEQTDFLDTYYDIEEGMRFPALLVSPEESYTVGGSLMHRVLTYAPLITYNQVTRNFPGELGITFGVSREEGNVVYYDSGWDRAGRILYRILVWAVLGAALLLSSCIGITSAMESLLSRKTEDIGMMRAIGATRRQIRRIYGTEAWLLTATALPAGLLLGVLASWIVSRIAPDQVVFSPKIWLLIPILGLSGACVFAASRLPLYHASRQMPMGVLRDTSLLRRAGKLKNHRSFRPDLLIAGRRTRLHPLRQAGAACMIALTLISTLMLGEIALGMRAMNEEDQPAYRLTGDSVVYETDPFTQSMPEDILNQAELDRLKAIEGVSKVRSVTTMTANLLLREIPEYFRTLKSEFTYPDGSEGRSSFGVLTGFWGNDSDWLFWSDEDLADARARIDEDWYATQDIRCMDQMNAIREVLGIDDYTVPVCVCVADLDAQALKEFVADGSVDTDKLDSGEQVLLYAPSIGVKRENDHNYSNSFLMPGDIREDEWDLVIRNDTFTAGMPLSLLEFTGTDNGDGDGMFLEAREIDWKAHFRSEEAVRAETTVGAVLTGPVYIADTYMYSFTVITTVNGAKALGLKLPNPEYTNIYLTGDPSPEEEKEITEQISQVAVRGWLNVENRLQLTRAYAEKKLRQVLLFAALILVFFAVSVFMQVSGAGRQIRSEIRTIGTLRAVGADLKTLVGCYRLPVWICAGAALIPCLLIYAVGGIPSLRLFTNYHPLVVVPVLAVLAACVALACTAGIRGRLAAVSRQSIVENIREL